MTNRISRRQWLSAAAAGPFIHTTCAADAKRPNFLFLLTDDQSYHTMSCTGSTFMKTPNMDRIAREGALFTNGFVAMSLCAPSRACFLTGLYPHTNGIFQNNIRFNQQLQTLPRLLHDAGYKTAHIGKFHMDGDDRVQPGYDYWAAQVGQGQYVNPRKNINGKWVDLKGYDSEIITNQAIDFMRANKDKPFCTWLAFKACHGPFTPAPGHEKDFADLEFKPPASFFSGNPGKPARLRQKGAALTKRGGKKRKKPTTVENLEEWAERERNQHRALMGAEDGIGKILRFLDEEKLAEDTIVFFSGDNGFFHGEFGLHGKMEAYDPSIRVPMMVRYPRKIKAGQRIDDFVVNVDLAPTILDLCGVKAKEPMQGRSWAPLVTGKRGTVEWRKTFLYETHQGDADPAHPSVKALRTDRYKLILNLNPKDIEELYDLKNDPQELKNIAAEKGNAGLIRQLKQQMIAAMKELKDPSLPLVEATL